MKKLLLILLCLPVLILAQVQGFHDLSYYYPPEESVANGGSYFDGGITHVVPFAYNGRNYPDSIYGFRSFLQIFCKFAV